MTTRTSSTTDRDYASAIADAAASAERALGEASIPVHILLSAQFGDLNDNQEEMLGAAASALDRLAHELGALRAIADAERGNVASLQDVVRIGDIVRTLLPELRDQAARAGVSLSVDIEPALPTTQGAAAQLRDAIRLVLTDDIRYAIPGNTVAIRVQSASNELLVTSSCGASRSVSGSLLLAERLLCAQGASLEHADGETIIAIPRR